MSIACILNILQILTENTGQTGFYIINQNIIYTVQASSAKNSLNRPILKTDREIVCVNVLNQVCVCVGVSAICKHLFMFLHMYVSCREHTHSGDLGVRPLTEGSLTD